jgi:hypothetical protein
MQVKLKTPRATDRGVQDRGDIIEVPNEEGQRMIAKGQAEAAPPAKANPQRQ